MKPAYMRVSPVDINGKQSKRLMIVLKTKGCEYARKTGGCTVCGFLNHADEKITEEQMKKQLDYALRTANLKGVKEIDLLTLGSFYNDHEISGSFRDYALKRVSKLKNIRRVSTESRAEYITVEKLREGKHILGDKAFELGIGLESSDDHIRNEIIRKNLSKPAFEKAIRKVKDAGLSLLVYLMIKPPKLSEKAAIDDAIKSAKYAFKTGEKHGVRTRVAFEPVFICESTPLETLYKHHLYRIVNLWSVAKVILEIHELGEIFVGLSDENLSYNRMPHSCRRCNEKLHKEIETFNRTQNVSGLRKLDCSCKRDYEYKLNRGLI